MAKRKTKTPAQIRAEAKRRAGGSGSGGQVDTSRFVADDKSQKKQKHAIGVPDDYKTPFEVDRGYKIDPRLVEGAGGTPERFSSPAGPRYKTGDPYRLLGGRSPEEIAQVQTALVKIGFLEAGKYQPGYFDKKTKAGFTEILGQANASGMTWNDLLAERVASAEATGFDGGGTQGPTKAPLTIALTNPKDITATLDSKSPELIGRNFSQAEKDAFVGDYQGQETAAQTQEYEMTGSGYAGGTGGTITKPPDIQAELIDRAKKDHPDEYQATQIGENARKIMQALTNGVQAGGQ